MQIIVNVSPQWGIGKENALLVRIHADMRRFKTLTTNNTIVCGRKTLESFPNSSPLPNRTNIVLTHDRSFDANGSTVCHNLSELASAIAGKDPDSVFVCGGEQIYRLLLPFCSKALVTQNDSDSPADRFFPNLNLLPNWTLTHVGEIMEEGPVRFRYLEYENNAVIGL
jgi:dihydrofolate reductase